MTQPPNPPDDCYETSSYGLGDEVYYLRTGKWREGTCGGKAGSSDGSTIYKVEDSQNGKTYIVDDCDMRKRR